MDIGQRSTHPSKMVDVENFFNRIDFPTPPTRYGENASGNGVSTDGGSEEIKDPFEGCYSEHSRNVYPYRIIFDVYVVAGLCVLGFVGNALSIAVLRRDHDKTNSTTWLLQALAVADTFYLISCLLSYSMKTIVEMTAWLPHSVKHRFPYIEPYLWPIAATAQTITVWIVVLVTADRYIAICRPFNSQIRSIAKIRIYVVLIVIMAVAYNIPVFFERVVEPCGVKGQGVRVAIERSDLYFIIYKTVCHLIFRSVGPLLALIVLNVQLMRALNKAQTRRKNLVTSSTSAVASKKAVAASKNGEGITLMLIVVVSVFIVCNLPDLCLRVAINIVTWENHGEGVLIRVFNSVSNIFLQLNSAINFLIYCLVGKKFRRILAQMFNDSSCLPAALTSTVDSAKGRQVGGSTGFSRISGVGGGGGGGGGGKCAVTHTVGASSDCLSAAELQPFRAGVTATTTDGVNDGYEEHIPLEER